MTFKQLILERSGVTLNEARLIRIDIEDFKKFYKTPLQMPIQISFDKKNFITSTIGDRKFQRTSNKETILNHLKKMSINDFKDKKSNNEYDAIEYLWDDNNKIEFVKLI